MSRTTVDIIMQTVSLCHKYYTPKDFEHALKVAEYARSSALCSNCVNSTDAYIVGMCHDLLEDTDIPHDLLQATIGGVLFSHVLDLTKDDDETYREYCERCAEASETVFLVKRADLKDHFMRKDTLTDKLKEKYLGVIELFLE